MIARSAMAFCSLVLVLGGCEGSNGLVVGPDGGSMNLGGQGAGGDGGGAGGAGGGVGGAAGGASGGAGGAVDAGVAPGPCDAPLGARVFIDDPGAIMAELPGRWVRCGHALTSNELETGLLIAADHRFALLVQGADGTVTASSSPLESGQVQVNPLGTFDGHLSFNLDFIFDANLDYRTNPFFTNGAPLELATTNTDILWLRYVRVDP
jgi:hypothetical protein